MIATAVSQIFTNTYQKSLDCNALQLLHLSAPLIAIGMLIMSPFFDDLKTMNFSFLTTGCIARISKFLYLFFISQLVSYFFIFLLGISCFFALGVNITNYLVLGMTSPLTYQVLGHLKTVLIIVLGFVLFNVNIIFLQ